MSEGNGDRPHLSVADLTVDQIEQLEIELGAPVDAWDSLPSRMRVIRRMYVLATGADDAAVGAMPMRELAALVSLGTEDDETGNPTDQPSG